MPNDRIWKDLKGCALINVQFQLYLVGARETANDQVTSDPAKIWTEHLPNARLRVLLLDEPVQSSEINIKYKVPILSKSIILI